jgi:RNase P/RNase MRP subunit POP5
MAMREKQTKAFKPKYKTNPLKPSMRERKRYIAFEIKSSHPLPFDADRQLIEKIRGLLGVFGSAKAGILKVKYNRQRQRGILRVGREYVDHTRACFVMVKELSGAKVAVHTVRVSGMIGKALAAAGIERLNLVR